MAAIGKISQQKELAVRSFSKGDAIGLDTIASMPGQSGLRDEDSAPTADHDELSLTGSAGW